MYALNVAGTTTLTGNTSIGGDVAITGDELKISSGGAPGSNPIPYFTIESLAVGTSYPVQQPQPGGGIKWIHNSTELASIQLASGVDNTLEINSTVGVNISSLTIANTLDVKTVKRKILHEKMNWNTSFVDSHTMNILDDGSVLHIYGGSNNLTLNIRGNASTTLDSILGTVTHLSLIHI